MDPEKGTSVMIANTLRVVGSGGVDSRSYGFFMCEISSPVGLIVYIGKSGWSSAIYDHICIYYTHYSLLKGG